MPGTQDVAGTAWIHKLADLGGPKKASLRQDFAISLSGKAGPDAMATHDQLRLRFQEGVMYLMKVIVPVAIAATGLLVCTSSVYGTAEYAKKEKKACTQCHSKVAGNKTEMMKNLTATGTCYKNSGHSLAKCSAAK